MARKSKGDRSASSSGETSAKAGGNWEQLKSVSWTIPDASVELMFRNYQLTRVLLLQSASRGENGFRRTAERG